MKHRKSLEDIGAKRNDVLGIQKHVILKASY